MHSRHGTSQLLMWGSLIMLHAVNNVNTMSNPNATGLFRRPAFLAAAFDRVAPEFTANLILTHQN